MFRRAGSTRAARRLDQLIGRGAQFIKALYDLAGMEGESDRIRQSSHRSRFEPAPEANAGEPEALPEAAASA